LGTNKVEKEVRYEKGHLTLIGFQDAGSHHEYIQGPPSNIFRFDIDGQVVTSESQPWVLEGSQTEILSQGELLFRITVRDSKIQVT
jgi:hypothetical protein